MDEEPQGVGVVLSRRKVGWRLSLAVTRAPNVSLKYASKGLADFTAGERVQVASSGGG